MLATSTTATTAVAMDGLLPPAYFGLTARFRGLTCFVPLGDGASAAAVASFALSSFLRS